MVQERILRTSRTLPTWALAPLAALALALTGAPAHAAEATFPELLPATQVSRELTLQQAAQAGLLKLQAKGGSEGDVVSLELQAKKVRAPIIITLRIELTVDPRATPQERALVQSKLPSLRTGTEAELNRPNYKARNGDPMRFKIDYQYRDPAAPERPNYHQVKVINPRRDLPEPEPDFRSEVPELGVPNRIGAGKTGTFPFGDLEPKALGHELLHLAGLDDRYIDAYRIGGREYPLPSRGMPPTQLRDYLRNHVPPLKPPPAGDVVAQNTKGTSPCDIMGSGLYRDCRRISRRDLDWFESQAGVQVIAHPGDLLLNKDQSKQNMGVGFQTTVFAAPGSTTVANGIAAYCIDHDRFFPLAESFDVGPSGAELPGYDGVVKLLQLNAALQPSLDETITGMQAAIWNLTDGSPLDTSGTAEESRALLAQAQVAEDSVPGGLPGLPDPNAASPDTAAIGATGAVLPAIAAQEAVTAPAVRVSTAQLFPSRVRAGRRVRSDLLIGTAGDAQQLTLQVQRHKGRRWVGVRTLAGRGLDSGTTVLPVRFGRLSAGRYRLVVTVKPSLGAPVVQRVTFSAT